MKLHQESFHEIQGPCGAIEAAASLLPNNEAVIVCHPDPQQEGTMFNKVVTSVVRACHEKNRATVRFNYRGVGKSAGSYGNVEGEVEDLSHVVRWLKKQGFSHYWLVGFSFGCFVSHEYQDPLVRGRLWIAPPVDRFSFKCPHVPTFILQGLADDVVLAESVQNWAQQNAVALQTVEDCGHFFHGKLAKVKSWTQECLSA